VEGAGAIEAFDALCTRLLELAIVDHDGASQR
jgi:hypothetical protein